MNDVSKLLTTLREESGLSKDSLAKYLATSVETISAVEQGKEDYSIQQLERFAHAIGVSFELVLIAVSDSPKELQGEDLRTFLSAQKKFVSYSPLKLEHPTHYTNAKF